MPQRPSTSLKELLQNQRAIVRFISRRVESALSPMKKDLAPNSTEPAEIEALISRLDRGQRLPPRERLECEESPYPSRLRHVRRRGGEAPCYALGIAQALPEPFQLTQSAHGGWPPFC